MKEIEKELNGLLDEKYQRSEHEELLNRLEEEQVLSIEKIEKDIQELGDDNTGMRDSRGIIAAMKEEARIKEEKNDVDKKRNDKKKTKRES